MYNIITFSMRSIHFHRPDKSNISHKNEVFYNYCIFYVKKLFSNDIIQKQIFIANRADINARALLTWFTILTGKYINHYDLKLIDYDRFLQKYFFLQLENAHILPMWPTDSCTTKAWSTWTMPLPCVIPGMRYLPVTPCAYVMQTDIGQAMSQCVKVSTVHKSGYFFNIDF